MLNRTLVFKLTSWLESFFSPTFAHQHHKASQRIYKKKRAYHTVFLCFFKNCPSKHRKLIWKIIKITYIIWDVRRGYFTLKKRYKFKKHPNISRNFPSFAFSAEGYFFLAPNVLDISEEPRAFSLISSDCLNFSSNHGEERRKVFMYQNICFNAESLSGDFRCWRRDCFCAKTDRS